MQWTTTNRTPQPTVREPCTNDVVLQGCQASLGHVRPSVAHPAVREATPDATPSLLPCWCRFSMAQHLGAPTPAQLLPPQTPSPVLSFAEALPTAQVTSIQASAGQHSVSSLPTCPLSSCVPCSNLGRCCLQQVRTLHVLLYFNQAWPACRYPEHSHHAEPHSKHHLLLPRRRLGETSALLLWQTLMTQEGEAAGSWVELLACFARHTAWDS